MDTIPDDVLTTILSYNIGNTTRIFGLPLTFVDTRRYAHEAIQFALISHSTERIFCKALSNRLILTKYTAFPEQLKQVFRRHIHQLYIDGYEGDIKRLLKSRKLTELSMRTFPRQFCLYKCATNLRVLNITVDRAGRLGSMENVIKSLKLRQLGIAYPSKFHKEVRTLARNIAKRSPSITTLEIEPSDRWTNTWPIIKLFCNVKNVLLTHDLAPPAFNRVRKLHSVKIKNCPEGIDLASKFPSLIVSVDLISLCPQCALKPDDIVTLSTCKKLSVLKAFVRGGVETELHRVSKNLKELELVWVTSDMLPQQDCETCPENAVKLQHGCLLRLVREASRLTRLSIFGAVISRKEIKQGLIATGRRLTKFGISVANQEIESIRFVQELLELLMEHNGGLQELNFRTECLDAWTDLGVKGEILLDTERRLSLERCLQRFHRCVPGVQMLYLVSLLNRMMRVYSCVFGSTDTDN